MENQSQKTPATAPSAPAAPVQAAKPAAGAQNVVAPQKQPGQPRVAGSPKVSNDVFVRKIVDKIKSSENILVALSRDPSVDEMAAAIGLTLFLDSLQKHTTAIYSGATPDALQFLQPEGTFETNTDSLQDFIIALNKDKADHLRYKLDGDFVKVYITPYKSNITEEDLEFSHGDFNVNLVLALGVPSAADLDTALAEHGRIMHDATTVDITIDAPGKFAEIEWSDPGASSVSEMVTKLIFAMQGEDTVLDKETATALLTGIVAATGRFSNDRTNSDTMQLASKLMSMGADQQLISAHVMDNDSGAYSSGMAPSRMDLAVSHEVSMNYDNGPEIAMEGAVVTPVVESEQASVEQPANPVAAEPSQAVAGPSQAELAAAASAAVNEAVATAAANVAAAGAVSPTAGSAAVQPQATIVTGSVANQMTQPPVQGMVNPLPASSEQKDYAQMMAQALAEPGVGEVMAQQVVTPSVSVETVSAEQVNSVATPAADSAVSPAAPSTVAPSANPAVQAAPAEAVQGPEPVAKPSGVTLPPPPAPVPTADMMPPTLPAAQAANMAAGPSAAGSGTGASGAGSNTPTAATQSDAFQIPGFAGATGSAGSAGTN